MACESPLHAPGAPADDRGLEYIEARSPSGAENVNRRLQGIIDLPADHPNSGRTINKGNLRRFMVIPYPYVIFYRADATGIVIQGVRHAARRSL